MARAGGLGGGLNLFGGGSTSFGAFSLTSATSSSEQSGLAYSVARAKHEAGLMSDAEFEAAQAAYLNGLDQKTAAGATAAYTISMQKYTDDRNALVAQVERGTSSIDALVAFDQQSLAGLDPNSSEYIQREDRLFSSQYQQFQKGEKQVIDDLNNGRITDAQAQEWYRQQASAYSSNPTVTSDAKNKIGTLEQRIVDKADSQAWSDFQGGKMTVEAYVAYASSAVASDPTSGRAKNLVDNIQTAKQTAVLDSLSARYALSAEYTQLAQFVAGSAPPAGHTTTSHQTRSYLTPGGWKTTTTAVNSYHAPSASEQAAWASHQAQVKEAKQRMADIKAEVAAQPGGWVTEDDMIAQTTALQATVVEGSRQWFAYQAAIDGYKQAKAKNALIAKTQGIHVAYPGVASENAQSMRVGQYEKPVQPGKTTVTGPKTSSAGAGGSGGSSGGGGASSSPAATGSHPSAVSAVSASGPADQVRTFQQIASSGYRQTPKRGDTAYVTTRTAIPVDFTPNQYEKFHKALIDAVRTGKASFTIDGKTNYAIPLDADSRLTFLKSADKLWLEMTKTTLDERIAKSHADPNVIADAKTKYDQAYKTTQANLWFIADSATPGAVVTLDEKGNINSFAKTTGGTGPTRLQTDAGAAGKVAPSTTQVKYQNTEGISINNVYVGPANPLGLATEILDASANYDKLHQTMIDQAMGRGDFQQAMMLANEVAQNHGKVQAQLIGTSGQASKASAGPRTSTTNAKAYDGTDASHPTVGLVARVDEWMAANGVAAPTKDMGTVFDDWQRLHNAGAELDAGLQPAKAALETILGPGANGKGYVKVSNGVPMLDGQGDTMMNDGLMRVMKPDGTIDVQRFDTTGYRPDGTPTRSDTSGKYLVANVKIGNSFKPVQVPWRPGTVGYVAGAHDAQGNPLPPQPVIGKIVNDPSGQRAPWTMNPFQPGVAIEGSVEFTSPPDLVIGAAGKGASKFGIPGITSATQVWQWTGPNGQKMLAYNDPSSGNMIAYSVSNVSDGIGSHDEVNPVEITTPDGQAGADASLLTDSGFKYNVSKMTPQQQDEYTLTSRYGARIGVEGAYLGATGDDISKMMNAARTVDTRNKITSVLDWATGLISTAQTAAKNMPQSGVKPGSASGLGSTAGSLLGPLGALDSAGSRAAGQPLTSPTGAGTPALDHGSAQSQPTPLPVDRSLDARAQAQLLPSMPPPASLPPPAITTAAKSSMTPAQQTSYNTAVKNVVAAKTAATAVPKVAPPPVVPKPVTRSVDRPAAL